MPSRVCFIAVLFLAVACDGPSTSRASCGDADPCGAGSYCARTPDGNVCWPDAVAPTVQAVTVTCAAPCLRDGSLRVTAEIADDQAVGEVTVALDVAPGQPVAMSQQGTSFAADVPLASLPFPHFEHAVIATVTARDQALNTTSVTAAEGQRPVVTRLRWTYDAGVPLTSPALLADGTVVVGRSATTEQVVAVKDGAKAWAASVGASFLTAAPAVGDDAIWVGSADGKLYAIGLDGTAIGNGCNTGAAVSGAAAVVGTRVVAGSGASPAVLVVADSGGLCNVTNSSGAITIGPVASNTGDVVVATGAILRSFTVAANGGLDAKWTGQPVAPTLEGAPAAPLAVDAEGAAWSIAASGKLNRTTLAAITENPFSASAGSSGPVILSDGSVVVGDAAEKLKRFKTPAAAWTDSGAITGVPTVPLVLGGPRPNLLVGTSAGWVASVTTATGQVAWTHKLSATGNPLQPPNLSSTPGAATSTAYLAGGDGKLYAIVVDGGLDTAAPWPKAFHDPRNTSNAGTAP